MARAIQKTKGWTTLRQVISLLILLNLSVHVFLLSKMTTTISRTMSLQQGKKPEDGWKRKLKLVHITKTGGLSLANKAAEVGIIWGICHFKTNELCTSSKIKERSDIEHVRQIFGPPLHTPWHIPPSWIMGGPYEDELVDTFAVVRDPYMRYLSEYYCPIYGYKGDNKDEAYNMNRWIQQRIASYSNCLYGGYCLSEFTWSGHFIPQHYYIFHEGRQRVTHVLHFENLSKEFDALMIEYGISMTLPNQKIFNQPKGLSMMNMTEETIQMINEFAWMDFEIFGYEMQPPFGRKLEHKVHTASPTVLFLFSHLMHVGLKYVV